MAHDPEEIRDAANAVKVYAVIFVVLIGAMLLWNCLPSFCEFERYEPEPEPAGEHSLLVEE